MQVEKARIHYENLSLSSACEAVLEIGNAGNAYMDENAPWTRFKQGGAASEAAAKVSHVKFFFFQKHLQRNLVWPSFEKKEEVTQFFREEIFQS